MFAALCLSLALAFTPLPADPAAAVVPEYAGGYCTEARITTYCPACNEPAGHGSASGVYLTAGHCACSWLPIGTHVAIDGEVFTVVDVCGTDAIDIFIDDDSGVCHCYLNEYRTVYIYE